MYYTIAHLVLWHGLMALMIVLLYYGTVLYCTLFDYVQQPIEGALHGD